MPDGFTTTTATPPLPCLALLRDRRPPPALPLDLFGHVWATRIDAAASAKNAPADYVLAGLLAAASACIGNARWASPWEGWVEPPFLWLGAVGNPSSSKSPGLGAVLSDVLPSLEDALAKDFPEQQRLWDSAHTQALAVRDDWNTQVRKAVQDDLSPPTMPAGAVTPAKPIRPRLITGDTTIEAVASLLAALTRGMLLHRDELAAFIGGFDRYGGGKGGADRASWLEAWNAGRKTVDRKQSPDPIVVRRFGLSIVGTIQPDRLRDIVAGPDDGLAVRFLWAFPAVRPFGRPKVSHDPQPWCEDLGRLLGLPMFQDVNGEDCPLIMSLTEAAIAVVEDFAGQWAAREATASGLMLGALGKARGQMVRLALVLELLRWCAERPGEEAPIEVGEESAIAAATLMENYFLPMAERAFGLGAIAEAERHASILLRHILATGAVMVNERDIRETPGLRGLSNAAAVRDAVAVLRREDVLLMPPQDNKPGRPRADHRVNPRLTEAYAALKVHPQAAGGASDQP